jgi:23S rRNA pseudouridine1911/1915/1917 synthase
MAVNKKGKEARTYYRVKEKINGYTLLQCSLHTGRTHQIRVHMLSIGHPLVGDPTYGTKPKKSSEEIRKLITDFPRQALHAKYLELIHPDTGQKVMWESELPEDFDELLQTLRKAS